MFEHWAVMWTVLQREHRRGSRNGLDDPLDGPEWRGLHWVLPTFSFLLNRRRSDARLTRSDAPLTERTGARWDVRASHCRPQAAGHDR
ncbi:hypothetical protein [Ensifer sp. SL37]|uniref:hypothetical protein n=1 Tax=Ensifer sp. SL37 TaxID=2995137 RepID=UPI0022739EE6|nr:hypothetical protein [Ensifer sp. SL37]MCY1744346.1 hypothetical protein [Ensifer sp. SL37]